jgi:hypothetical protein
MNRHEKELKKLLHTYHLENKIPEDVQQIVMQQSVEQLASILKKTDNYSIYFAALLFIIDKAAKHGVRFSFLQSKIILFVTTFATLSTFSTGSYLVAVKIIAAFRNSAPIIERPLSVTEPREGLGNNTKHAHVAKIEKYSYGIPVFQGDRGQVQEVTRLLVRDLNRTIGAGGARIIHLSQRNQVDKLVYGSLRTAEGKTILTVKIVNPGNAAVEYLITEEVAPGHSLASVTKKIARQLAIRM